MFRRILAGLAVSLLPAATAAAQEPATLTGRVTIEGGAPLAGTTIAIPQLGLGTTTREDGSYSIVVFGARVNGQVVTLTARRVGYKPKNERLTLDSGPLTIDFELYPNPLQLGEVVVTGAGTVSEVEKLGSVRNAVSPTLIAMSNEANVVQALAGKAPNVQVAQSAGDPGAGSKITIRGLRTLNGDVEPLFVVDGVPMSNATFSTTNFNVVDAGGTGLAGQDNGGQLEGTSAPNRMMDLNPIDIESVEVLKGAAAAAIYGARAANGVILIATKRGHSGQTRYAVRSSLSSEQVTKKYPLQRTYGQGLLGVAGLATRSWGATISGPSYDHASEAFDTGHIGDNTLSVSGGNDRTTLYLSGGYNHNEGVFVGPNNFFDRATVRLNATHQLTDGFTVGANFSYADTRGHFTQRGNTANGLLLGLLRTPPDFNNLPYLDPVSGLHRSYMVPDAAPNTAGLSRVFNNPFFTLFSELNEQTAARTFGNVNAAYEVTPWLKFNYTLGGDYANDERLEGCPAECSDVAVGGRITEGKLVDYQLDHNLTGTATWQLSDLVGGSVTLGQNLNARNFRTFSIVGRGLVAPAPFSILNTLTRDPPSDYRSEVHSESYFGQATIDLANQLFLTGAVRNDGSTTFGKAQRSLFPKASMAWAFTNGFKPYYLSFGKLRVSYGEAGQEPQPYLTSPTFSGTNLVGGTAQGTGFTPTQGGLGGLFPSFMKPARTLKPERTRELEAGIDLGFLGERADLSATWYRSRTTDVILVTPIAPSTGYANEAKNAGIFRNTGAEVSFNVRPVATTSYSWDIGLGWARNESMVESIAGAQFLLTDFALLQTVAQTGYPLGVMRGNGWVRCGLSQDNAVPGQSLASLCATAKAPYGATYIDDGTHCSPDPGMPCADNVTRVIGDPNPKWTGNAHTTIRFRNIELSGLIDIKNGGQTWNGTKGALYSYGTHQDTENRAACTGPSTASCSGNLHAFGEPNFYPGPVFGPGVNTQIPIGENWYRTSGLAACPFTGYDEPCVEGSGYVKLREVSIAYTFDRPWVARALGLSSLDVRLSGRNLKTWTRYTGLDPETTLGGASTRVGGQDYFNLPLTRAFVFTVGLNR